MNRLARTFMVLKCLESFNFGWLFGVYVLFLLENGLTLAEVSFLNVGYMTVSFLVDPYTGRLADRIGQKRVYIQGLAVAGLGLLVYGFGRNFTEFMLAEAIFAVGWCLMSMALESWLRNEVGQARAKGIISRTGVFTPYAGIPSAAIGGFVGGWLGLQWPFFLAGLSWVLSAVIAVLFLRGLEESRPQGGELDLPSVRDVFRWVWRTKSLRFSLLVVFLARVANVPISKFWLPLLEDKSGASWWLGMVWIGITIFMSLGSYLSEKSWAQNGYGIGIALGIYGLPILMAALFSPHWTFFLLFFLLHEVGRGFLAPALVNYSNRHERDQVRSTANSIRSASGTLGAAVGSLITGLLVLVISPLATWALAAIVLLLSALYAWREG